MHDQCLAKWKLSNFLISLSTLKKINSERGVALLGLPMGIKTPPSSDTVEGEAVVDSLALLFGEHESDSRENSDSENRGDDDGEGGDGEGNGDKDGEESGRGGDDCTGGEESGVGGDEYDHRGRNTTQST